MSDLDLRFCFKGHYENLARYGDRCPYCKNGLLTSLLPFFTFMKPKVR